MKSRKNLLKTVCLCTGLAIGGIVFESEYGLFIKKDADVMRVVKTIKKFDNRNKKFDNRNSRPVYYDFKDGNNPQHLKAVYFYYRTEGKNYLASKIFKNKSDTNEFVIIKDYHLNGLDSQDEIIYIKHHAGFMEGKDEKTVKFGDISNDLQKKIQEEYTSMIKEAPEKILEQREKDKIKKNQEKEKEKKEFINKVLKIIKNQVTTTLPE